MLSRVSDPWFITFHSIICVFSSYVIWPNNNLTIITFFYRQKFFFWGFPYYQFSQSSFLIFVTSFINLLFFFSMTRCRTFTSCFQGFSILTPEFSCSYAVISASMIDLHYLQFHHPKEGGLIYTQFIASTYSFFGVLYFIISLLCNNCILPFFKFNFTVAKSSVAENQILVDSIFVLSKFPY